ncbi:hypothetical protein K501DRAFT_286783 [Backusella circina FSU 941]|nr:hypothetical protein K501DRAFT_286783 [Backusella circina FSU 941]
MVALLGDAVVIINPERYYNDLKAIKWSHNGVEATTHFIYIPFICLRDQSIGFFAIEAPMLDEFKKMMKQKECWDTIDFRNPQTMYHVTITERFQFGQNKELSFRFFVLQNMSIKAVQDQYIFAADVQNMNELLQFGTRLSEKMGDYATPIDVIYAEYTDVINRSVLTYFGADLLQFC